MKSNKSKKFTDEGSGKGTIHRPTNPSNLFRKGKKRKETDKQTTYEDRAHALRDLDNKKKRKAWTEKSDDAYDRKHGIKEGSKRDIALDHSRGLAEKKKRKSKAKVIKAQTIAHKAKGKKKNWIAGAIKHPGALHREMGVKAGNKIPAGKLAAAAGKKGVLGRRARLAETLEGMHHKKDVKKKAWFNRVTGKK